MQIPAVHTPNPYSMLRELWRPSGHIRILYIPVNEIEPEVALNLFSFVMRLKYPDATHHYQKYREYKVIPIRM